MKKYADVQMNFTVEFDDDDDLALKDQAMQAAEDLLTSEGRTALMDASVIGEVRDSEMPA